MEPKNNQNYLKKYDEKSFDKLQYKLVFNSYEYLSIFKKTEKIVAALYLITGLISDSEPIKLQIRKISLQILSYTLTLKQLNLSKSKEALNDISVGISEVISLLKVASVSNHISPMNYSLIHQELVTLMGSLNTFDLGSISDNGLVLTQDFFNIPENNLVVSKVAAQPVFSKGQYRTPVSIKDKQSSQTLINQPNQKDNLKDSRRETIVRLLKGGKPLGIKDFASEIKDCSEKTIQRELIDMVENGVLKKTGERRWSTYSLV